MTWRRGRIRAGVMLAWALVVGTGCGAGDGPALPVAEDSSGDGTADGTPSVAPAGATAPSARTLYLANPYGFSAQQRDGPLQELAAALVSLGAEVWEPFARTAEIDPGSPGWAYRIGQANLRDVREADGVFAVVNGCPPDEGVMVELEMAIAWEKPVFLFRDDFRRCTDSETYPLNLMLFVGLPETGWEASWYASIEELADPEKALGQWLTGP